MKNNYIEYVTYIWIFMIDKLCKKKLYNNKIDLK